MALNTQITNMADVLSGSLLTGSGNLSVSLGGDAPAFSWAAGQLPTIADHVATTTSEGMSAPVTVVAESATPAAVVAEGGPKPSAIDIDSQTVQLSKHAGTATASLEAFLNSSNLAGAISGVLNTSCLKSFEKQAITVLAANSGQTVTGATDWVSAVGQAQAQLLAEGAVPSLIVLSAADYPAFLSDVLGTNAFSSSPESPIGGVLGLPLHVSSGAVAGSAYVLDGQAVLAVQHQRSPVGVADPFSGSSTNTVRLVLDLLASVFVTFPRGVVKVTAPVAAMAAGHAKRK